RVIPIKLKRPSFSATWESDVRGFARSHRWEILADVRERLEGPKASIRPMTRWATWEEEVLSRVEMSNLCQEVIVERQRSVDEDTEERDIVADHFRQKLTENKYNPERECLFLLTGVVASWVNEATNQKMPTNRASTYLAGLGIPEL